MESHLVEQTIWNQITCRIDSIPYLAWIQLITFYNFYIWNKILDYMIKINYTIWNMYEIELTFSFFYSFKAIYQLSTDALR
jgi:hypothetical protein